MMNCGNSYDKLKDQQLQRLKDSRQGKWAKWWWDDEVFMQYKVVGITGRGGVGPRVMEREAARVRTWKTEKPRQEVDPGQEQGVLAEKSGGAVLE